jgi:hypothetical protein
MRGRFQKALLLSSVCLVARACLPRNLHHSYRSPIPAAAARYCSTLQQVMTVSDEDFLRLDAGDFRDLFDRGTLTIAALTARALEQIKKENANGLSLRAIIFVAPESQLQERADVLDQELRSGHSRGRLHGIPVVLKVLNHPNHLHMGKSYS